MQSLKPSIYNFIVNIDNALILYNSRTGIKKVYFGKEKEYIVSLLNQKTILEFNDNIDSLQKFGFLVNNDFDELMDVMNRRNSYLKSDELFLMILPTESCNFRCVYCYENFSRSKMSMSTVNNIKKFVSNELHKHSKLTVAWFGGEPLLAMDIIEDLSLYFLDICAKLKKPYFSMMTTNGYLLTPKNIDKLKKCHITGYQITLDGLSNTHNRQRVGINGNGTWEQIISNLIYFRDNIKSKTINIAIRTNISKEIYDKRKEYLMFLKTQFGKDSRFHFFFHLIDDWGNLEGKDIKKSFCGPEEFYSMILDAAELNLPLTMFKAFLQPGSRICFAAKENAYVISSEGSIRKCSEHLYEDYNYLCNINDSTNFNSENKFWDCISKSVSEDCQKCRKLPLCYGLVCPAYRGPVKDTCGCDFSDMPKILYAISRGDGSLKGDSYYAN